MPGSTCWYALCHRRQLDCPNLRMYRFPTDQDLQKKWVINSGNPVLLQYLLTQLRNKFICQNNFFDADFVNSVNKNRLVRGAVPIPFSLRTEKSSPLTIKLPTRTYKKTVYYWFRNKTYINVFEITEENEESSINLNTTWEICDTPVKRKLRFEDSPQTEKLKVKLLRNSVTLKTKTSQVCKLKQRVANLKRQGQISKKDNILNTFPFCSSALKTVVKIQLKKNRRVWEKDEKNFSLALYYKSPATCKFLKSQGVVLPSVSSILKFSK